MDELFSDLLALARERPGVGRRALAPRRRRAAEGAWERSIRAKALDLLRGLLPASTLSHVGIFASGQAYEQLLLRMLASPLPEAREFAAMILEELKKVMPSFVARVERPDRGGEWISYLEQRRDAAERWVARLGLDRREGCRRPLGRAGRRARAARTSCSRPRCSSRLAVPEREIAGPGRALPPDERADVIAELAGERANRRHRPGRGWEAVRYRFEIVSDYGGFRDLQRHRMLTCQWQRLTPGPRRRGPRRGARGRGRDEYERALELSRARVRAARGRRDAEPPRPTRSASATGSATCST